MLNSTAFKNLLDAGALSDRIKMNQAQNTNDDALDDVAQNPTKYDDENGCDKIRQEGCDLGRKGVPGAGHGNHGVHNSSSFWLEIRATLTHRDIGENRQMTFSKIDASRIRLESLIFDHYSRSTPMNSRFSSQVIRCT